MYCRLYKELLQFGTIRLADQETVSSRVLSQTTWFYIEAQVQRSQIRWNFADCSTRHKVKRLTNCWKLWQGIVWMHTSVQVLFMEELRLWQWRRGFFWCNLHTGGGGDRGDLEAWSPIHAKRGFRWITRVTMVYQKNRQINAKKVSTLLLCSWLCQLMTHVVYYLIPHPHCIFIYNISPNVDITDQVSSLLSDTQYRYHANTSNELNGLRDIMNMGNIKIVICLGRDVQMNKTWIRYNYIPCV